MGKEDKEKTPKQKIPEPKPDRLHTIDEAEKTKQESD